MSNTGERREITKRGNANEEQKIQQSKSLVSHTKESIAEEDARNQARKDRRATADAEGGHDDRHEEKSERS